MKYKISEIESGAAETVDASDFDEAVEKAQDWLDGGDWGEEEDYVSVKITDADGNEKKVELVVGGPTPPECMVGMGHKWESPHELLGGLRENPGVCGLQGTQLDITEVCGHCGYYRQTITKSSPNSYPRTPERVTYRKPDAKSLAWAGVENEDES